MPGWSFDALYYPYIHFWDVGWLKSTALYWDSMSRIVPDGFEPDDPDEVKRLIDAGYIRNDYHDRRPGEGAVADATAAISRLLATHRKKLQARYGLQNRESWAATNPNVSSLRWVHQVPELELDPRLGYMCETKFSQPILDDLIDAELAEPVREGRAWLEGAWYGVHPKLEEAYLWALASETARTRGRRLLADNPRHHTAIMGDLDKALRDFLLRPDPARAAPARTSPNLDAVMMTIVLRNVRPRDYNNLPAEEITSLRKRTTEARTALQRELQRLVFDEGEYLEEIRDTDVLERRLGDLYNRRLKPSLDEMEKAVQVRHRVDWGGTLTASFAIPPSLLAAQHHPAAWPLLVVCAGGPLVVALWRGRTSLADLQKQDPVAFYLQQIADMKETAVAEAVATSVQV